MTGLSDVQPQRSDTLGERDRLFDLSLDLLCVGGFDGYFKEVNAAWPRTLGWSERELLSRPWIEFVHHDDRKATLDAGAELEAGREVRTFENRYQCKDGTYRWLSWNSSPDPQRKLVYCACRDVTATREAQESLHLREAELRSIFVAAPIGIGITVQRVIRAVNDRFCEMLGYAREELIGRNGRMMYLSDEEYTAVGQQKFGQIEARGVGTVETRWRRKDGRILDVLLSSAAIEPANWDAGMIFTALDITERKRAEAALRDSEERYRNFVANATEGIYRIDFTEPVPIDLPYEAAAVRIARCAVIGEVNEALARMYGLRAEDMVGRPATDFAPDYGERGANLLQIKNYQVSDVETLDRDSQNRPLHLIESYTGRVEDGQLVRVWGVQRDVTEQKRLESELRQAQKMEAIGQLAGGVAHDFNNILTAVFGNVELAINELGRRLPTANGLLDSLRQIERSAHRAATLTRQLLTFSRRQIVRPEALDINAVLSTLEKMLRRLITENIDLQLILEPDVPPIKADRGQFEQVIVNLAVNARDAMPDGGRLTLETRSVMLDESHAAALPRVRPGSYVQLVVCDTGHGMDRATLDRIFEPFFTTKPTGQGTGLGLSTVYGIVKQAGGHIAVYSEPHGGTSFRVYLPSMMHPAPALDPALPELPPPTGTETIMVCEDDDAVRTLTAQVLASAGYDVLAASGAEEALQAAAEYDGPIHLLVTDVIMPGLNGRQLSDRLSRRRPDVRTLYVSGYTANVIAHHGVLDGNVRLLEKPYSRRQLLCGIRDLLDQGEASAAR